MTDKPAADRSPPLRLVLMGTGPFAVPCFDEVARRERDTIHVVITKPELPGARGQLAPPSPVALWAESRGLRIQKPSDVNSDDALESLRSLQPDVLLVCDYGRILSSQVLRTARLGGLNLHGSLLPRHRGAAPVNWAIWRGDARTGVSVIHLTPRLDAGPVLSTRSTEIGEDESAVELEQRLAELGRPMLADDLDALRRWDGVSPIGTVQDESSATKAPRLKKADGRIDWSQSATSILNQFRALQPWPGVFTFVKRRKGELRVLVVGMRRSDLAGSPDARPGEVVALDASVHVAVGDGVLKITDVQPAGKQAMPAADWLRGRVLEVGQRLGA